MGSNKAGKSTLIKSISNLVPLSQGGIYLDDNPIHTLQAYRIPSLGIAHVPEGRQIFPGLTVEENLFMGAMVGEAKAMRSEGLELTYSLFSRFK